MGFAVTDLADWFRAVPISATVCLPSPWQVSRPLRTAGCFSVLGSPGCRALDSTALSFQRHGLNGRRASEPSLRLQPGASRGSRE